MMKLHETFLIKLSYEQEDIQDIFKRGVWWVRVCSFLY